MRRSFDRIATAYRPLERLVMGHSLQRARTSLLDHLRDSRKILILGEGDGRLLQALLAINPAAEVCVVDGSEKMVAEAKRRIGAARRVSFFVADARSFLPVGPFDAVVTAFFLDCFGREDQRALIHDVATRLIDGGLWLYVDFLGGGTGWQRVRRSAWLRALYTGFRLLTDIAATKWHDPLPQLEANGLQRLVREDHRARLLTAQIWTRPTERPEVAHQALPQKQ